MERIWEVLSETSADVVLFPELSLTGYSCGDLFLTDSLLDAAQKNLLELVRRTEKHRSLVVVGLPFRVNTSLMNVAAVVAEGRILGMVPKSFLPTYQEFYEGRYFRAAGPNDPIHVTISETDVPFGTDLLFEYGPGCIAVEICEDLWGPIPPSSRASLAGANVLLNLSSSNETIGKAQWRRDLVRVQSGRCIAAYAYASAGAGESSSDVVFGGHCLVAENGRILDESRRIGDGEDPVYVESSSVTCDVDLQQLAHDRRKLGTFGDAAAKDAGNCRRIGVSKTAEENHEGKESLRTDPAESDWRSDDDQCLTSPNARELRRKVDPHPFVPSNERELGSRCSEILAIQVAGLVKRLTRLPKETTLAIGVSGGLDSTLALLVTVQACDALGWSRKQIQAMMMPGFGTSNRTRVNAETLIEELDASRECVDIRAQCIETFGAMEHLPFGLALPSSLDIDEFQQRLMQLPDSASDLVFENVQARLRTLLLMTRGFVIGTGDMSEQALGWSTYNADHMSMYNVNTSVPKSLVRFLVRHIASQHVGTRLAEVLLEISDTPISPELLPTNEKGEIRQDTESTVGPYELHDFFLYHFIRYGASREKILYLASNAIFENEYSRETIESTLDTFFRRFFANQFKRNCVPDGPKVGSVSLSPRGDWRMPSDADSDAF